MASSNELQSLSIPISADATPAIAALKSIANESKKTKTQIDNLSKSTSDANASLRDLGKTIKSLDRPVTDIFGLKTASASLKQLDKSVVSLKTNFGKIGKEFRDSLNEAYKDAKKISDRFQKPRQLFKVDVASMGFINKMDRLLDRFEKDRTDRRALIQEEYKLLKYRAKVTSESAKSITAEVGKFKTYIKDAERMADKLSKLESAFAGVANSISKVKLSKSLIEAASGTATASKGDKNADAKLKNALDRNTAAHNRNTSALQEFGRTALITDIGRRVAIAGYEDISNLQKMKARVDAWGLDQKYRLIFEKQTRDLRQNNPLISTSDAYSMMMSAASSIGHYDPKIVGKTVQQVTKYAQMERALGYNVSDIGDIAKNYYGVAEARQVANDVQKTLDTFRTVFRITTTTAGKITVGDVETILRNMGPGAATISDEGLLRLLAYAEQIKVAGRGSAGSAGAGISTVGTNVKMLQLMAMGKPSSIHAKKMLAQLGLLEDSAYISDDNGGYRLNFDAEKNKKGANEALVAQTILERGDLGQIIGKVGRGALGTFASSGFYDKRTAQEDPVKFVENMIPLIESFTAQAERRQEYYGAKAMGKESMTAEEFLKTLTLEDITSAMTTFWAKTGLSSRVVQALTTFSNKNFIERSEHMRNTAMHQKSAEEIMREQIDNGNIMLATQRVQKAIENLLQAFEPMSGILGKAAMMVGDLIDRITAWVNEYQTLASMTAGWLVFKYLAATMRMVADTYNLLDSSAKKAAASTNALATAQQKQAQTATGGIFQQTAALGSQPINQRAYQVSGVDGLKNQPVTNKALSSVAQTHTSIIVGTLNNVKKFASETRSIISKLGSFITRTLGAAFSGIGMALLAVDVASIVWQWIKEFQESEETIVSIFSKIADKIAAMNPLRYWTPNSEGYRSETQNAERTKLLEDRRKAQAEVDEARANVASLSDGNTNVGLLDVLSGNADQKAKNWNEDYKKAQERLTAAVNRLAEIDEKLAANKEEPGRINAQTEMYGGYVKNWIGGATSPLAKLFKDIGLNVKGRNELERKIDLLGMSGTTDLQQEAFDKQRNIDLLINRLPEMIKGAPRGAFDRYDEYFAGIENKEMRINAAQQIRQFFNEIAAQAGLGKNFFDSDKRYSAESLAEYGTDVRFGPVTTLLEALLAAVRSEANQTELGLKIQKNVDPSLVQAGKTGLPQDTDPTKFDRLVTERENLRKRISQAVRPGKVDEYGGQYESYDEILQKAREDFIKDLVAGKYRRKKNESPFQTRKIADDVNGAVLTKDDFDVSDTKDPLTGISGNQMVAMKAAAQIAEAFRSKMNSATSSIVATMHNTANSLSDAQLALDDYSSEYAQSQSMRDYDRETERLASSMTKGVRGTPAWTKQMEDEYQGLLKKREQQRLQQSRLSGLTAARSYNTESRELSYAGMTRKQQLDQQYWHESRLASGEKDQLIRDIQESADRNAVIADSEEERQCIYDEANATILEINDAYYKLSLEREQNYLRDRNGFNSTHLDQTIEDWQDLGSQIESLQTEMMEGFVEANEKWLDGDEQSWREYFNNLLKMWRNIALKQGYSDLLGGMTKGITDNFKSFLAESFDRPNENPNNIGSALGSMSFGRVWDWAMNLGRDPTGGYTWNPTAPTTMNGGVQPGVNSVMTTVGNTAASVAGSLPWNRPGAGNVSGLNSSIQNAASAGVQGQLGTGMTDAAMQNGGDLISTLSGVADSGAELNAGFGNLISSGDLLNEGNLTLQATELAGNALQTTSNALAQTETTSTVQANVALATFTTTIQTAVSAVMTFISSLQSQQMASTASSFFANGGIMTSKGPLPLKTYANGGIAKEAQVAVFGEGRQPEAYVPLPDGRSIPVTVNGGNSQTSNMNGNNVVISINVTNNANGTGQETATNSGLSEQTSNMKKLANNIKSMVKQEIYNQSRPGGLLYNGR